MLPLLANVKKNNKFPRGLAFEVLGFKTPLMTLSFFNVYLLPSSYAELVWGGHIPSQQELFKVNSNAKSKAYAEALKR